MSPAAATPQHSVAPPAGLTAATFLDELPDRQRELFELRLCRLVLKAARLNPTDSEVTP